MRKFFVRYIAKQASTIKVKVLEQTIVAIDYIFVGLDTKSKMSINVREGQKVYADKPILII